MAHSNEEHSRVQRLLTTNKDSLQLQQQLTDEDNSLPRQLFSSKDSFLIQLLTAIVSFLLLTAMNGGESLRIGAALICIYLCLTRLLRKSALCACQRQPFPATETTAKNSEDAAAPCCTFSEYIADTNALLRCLLLVFLLIVSWDELIADDLGQIVRTGAILAVGFMVAGPGQRIVCSLIDYVVSAVNKVQTPVNEWRQKWWRLGREVEVEETIGWRIENDDPATAIER